MVEVVNEVRRAIATMSHNPADFFHLVDPLTKSLSARIIDAATLNAVVEEIFQQVALPSPCLTSKCTILNMPSIVHRVLHFSFGSNIILNNVIIVSNNQVQSLSPCKSRSPFN